MPPRVAPDGVGCGSARGHWALGPVLAQTVAPNAYVLAAVSHGKLGIACAAGAHCEARQLGGRVAVGANLPTAWRLALGPAVLDTVEVGYSQLGSHVQTQGVSKTVFVGTATPARRVVQSKVDVSAVALTLDALTHARLADDLTAWLRVGLAAVATTAKSFDDGASLGSVTENHLAPHLGLGVDWALTQAVVLSAGVDSTRVSASGASGRSMALHLGAKVGF